ncbi:flagellar basal-body rod protein FlgG [Alkaliphilus hydrothermalis]|uniref:Flagellar basal-body rod protein FlgG n=1 Tax=Alkaliphilus hydrothermalis TaxID=1482730 RepID=A0ABS2NQM6_9FIRM|nr:flagellar basal-body rod protein FlgG [Alkaliphilus hydrothermalis]MBM7615141.1 flagellar basal-body rod protein FlgG [Alkaliphilus hydrothermalis]
MRALWTAASGMKAQQLNMDTISNNLANVNTTAYKKQRVEFKDLLYATLSKSNINDGTGRPVNLQVGHGVMPSGTSRSFITGSLEKTESPYDLAIDGEGFFAIEGSNGEFTYTRDGNFKISVEDTERKLVTSDGYAVLSEFDDVIVLEEGLDNITISDKGLITAENEGGEIVEIASIKLVKFMNPEGLESIGRNLYKSTVASGEEIRMEEEGKTSNILQGYLETSNVQVVDEMVRMITAQRAYEISSKAIQTGDEMLGIANNLKR